MKNILITGAAGFLGSHLSEKLIQNGYNVIGIDNFLTGSEINLENLKREERFTFIEHDILKPIRYNGPISYILNFASPASPIDYLKIPISTLKIGSIGTLNCLNLAKEKKARILVASTSEIYGDPLIHPQPESYWGNVNSIGPRSVYDEAKRFMESLTMAYRNKYNVDSKIVRIFNTYGPRMRLNDGRALPTFILQLLKNEKLTIFGDGSQTRSFCYVDDLVEGIIKLLFSNYYLPVNIGNPHEISLLEFADKLIEISGRNPGKLFMELPKDDPKRRKPNIEKAREVLNWEPKVNLSEGLNRTYEYYKQFTYEKLNEFSNPREFINID